MTTSIVKTILLVDDEEDLRTIVRVTLEGPEYRIVEAADGDSALSLVDIEHPDLLILDWMMPKRNGLEVAQALRQDPQTKHLPVIFLTARDKTEGPEGGQAPEPFAYLVKPFSPLQLLKKVREALT